MSILFSYCGTDFWSFTIIKNLLYSFILSEFPKVNASKRDYCQIGFLGSYASFSLPLAKYQMPLLRITEKVFWVFLWSEKSLFLFALEMGAKSVFLYNIRKDPWQMACWLENDFKIAYVVIEFLICWSVYYLWAVLWIVGLPLPFFLDCIFIVLCSH